MSDNLSESQSNNSNFLRNILIAITAVSLSVAIFLGLQTEVSSSSIEAQVKASTPLDVALSNGKPSLTEFYADWCTSCQAMAGDLAEIKQKYGQDVNFVMLNVDNTKWLPEILRYRVDGIPHFVFINQSGEAIAESIGEQPRSILEADLDALIANNPLPYTYSSGQVSQFEAPVSTQTSNSDDPRSHGAQVQN
ncbi:MAG: thioredoxin family protein [Xenococcaceae cyanobacterium MO_188.B29]|nr:thioredoxin family protein [Xenococcaceae cyanobacterium MO_188.B29]